MNTRSKASAKAKSVNEKKSPAKAKKLRELTNIPMVSNEVQKKTSDNENSARNSVKISSNDQPLSVVARSLSDEADKLLFKVPISPMKRNNLSVAAAAETRNGNTIGAIPSPSKVLKLSSKSNDEEYIYETMRSVLVKQVFNSVDRLKLDFEPPCSNSIVECARNHYRNGLRFKQADSCSIKDTIAFITEDRPDKFLHSIAQKINSNEFPGVVVLGSMFKLILTVNKPKHKKYTTNDIIESTWDLFERIIVQYPPCLTALRPAYQSVLMHELDIDVAKGKFNLKAGLFHTVLSMIEMCFLEEDNCAEDADSSQNDSMLFDSSLPDSDSMDNFFKFEAKFLQKYEFDKLPRNDKIERLFTALHLLVKLMESDLAMWMIRFPERARRCMIIEAKRPLIAYLLWPKEECGQLNAIIKKILDTFVICVEISFPKYKIDILARLVNLVANACNLCELQPDNNQTQFPFIQSHSEIFVKELVKTIKKIQTTEISLYLAVINSIKTPFVRLALVNDLLQESNRKISFVSMKIFYKYLMNKKWTFYPSSMATCDRFEPAPSTVKHPVYKKSLKVKTSEIYQNEFIELLRLATLTYLDLYQIEKCAKYFLTNVAANQQPSQLVCNITKEQHESRLKDAQKQQNSYLSYKSLQDQCKVFRKHVMDKAKTDFIFYPSTELDCNICMDSFAVLKYREDMKYYAALKELIQIYLKDYPNLFDKWQDFVCY